MQRQHVIQLEDVIELLKESALRLKNSMPGGNYRDLQPLANIVGDAHIVAFGEATRGNHEFFMLKHRCLEFLVREQGFTLLAIEDGLCEVECVNHYVLTGEGDPKELLNGLLSWTWKTQEMLDVIEWMREYNKQRGEKPALQLLGLDMQSCTLAMINVLNYIGYVDADAVSEITDLYQAFGEYTDDLELYSNETIQVKQTCWSQLQRVHDLLVERRATYEKSSSHEAFAYALQCAQIVLQAEEMYSRHDFSLRSRSMAENVAWHLAQYEYEARICIWTHNGHAAAASANAQPRTLGSYLNEMYGNDLVSFCLLLGSGTFNAEDRSQPGKIITPAVGLAPQQSYEALFGAVGLPRLLIDLQGLPDVPYQWIQNPHCYRLIGAAYTPQLEKQCWATVCLPDVFDAVMHVQEGTPSRLLNAIQPAVEAPRQLTAKNLKGPRNLRFEAGLAFWQWKTPQGYTCEIETTFAYRGHVCAYLQSTATLTAETSWLGQMLPSDLYRQRRIRLSANVKARNVTGYAGLWMHIGNADGHLSVDDMSARPIVGTRDWARYEIVLDVSAISSYIQFGLALSGSGQVWIDDVQLETVSTEVPLTGNIVARDN
ncbi:erythromycin esterase family protein [Dictyobacter arantiisoli]|uniref:Erythromycin esterase n=1 Tax=Dictyobacter arantiisoli TaxID=2014874 RepID=A0A5A5T7U1_9CHLR|nr:erythromycin esterase family protein [Dictyobacter arantiisoli]GCF07462.1 hypothetical protein KDI_10260 [Dictyobacter arantiisoli]